ncbi:hypothetical protein GALMADRAFT_241585 [Galerina marginata CBS 339.88]|uniref:Uncharacterized protein n=1 Tax=Galerina marginata (strain CBS 339.88) TaxID=685588 RepID=A0A067TF83_GALM3|nr:hypothetical protein GALMADRAFT_241585 [Galerina marginata CBS 339.88]
MDQLPTTCIESNPDIAGIGVLCAVYAQAILSFVASGLATTDGIITTQERERNSVLPKGNLFLSISITSIALIRHTKLSVYHSLIVLNFGWILEGPLSLTSSSIFVRAAAASFAAARFNASNFAFDAVQQGTATSWWMFVSRFLQATFGIFVWRNITTYGGGLAKCTDRTSLFILGGIWTVPVLNNVIKKFSILVYGVRLLDVMATLPNAILGWKLQRNSDIQIHVPIAVGRLFLALLFVGVLMVDTATMIKSSKNSNLVSPGESYWGFGQILSALASVYLGIEALKDVRKWWNGQRWWKSRRTTRTEQDKVPKQETASHEYRAHVVRKFISEIERKLSIEIRLPKSLLSRREYKKDDQEMGRMGSNSRVDRATGAEQGNDNTTRTMRQRRVPALPFRKNRREAAALLPFAGEDSSDESDH